MAVDTKAPAATTAAARYAALENTRLPYLQRAREAATLTIPGLLPPPGATGATTLTQPFQSTGADGVNSLAAKLLMGLFPPGITFFRLTMDDFVVAAMMKKEGANGEKAKVEFDEALGKVERAVINRMEQNGSRTQNFEALQHLIVTGNGLMYVDEDGRQQFYPIDRYVCKRDNAGNLLDVVLKESLARESLPPKARVLVESAEQQTDRKVDQKDVDLYTWVKRQADGTWTVLQEVEGQIVPDSQGTYPKGKSAWLALRWRIVPGEDYGRGRCEEYIGDLRSLEFITQAIVVFTVAAAKVLFLVDESGTTDPKECTEAPSGAFIQGNAKDITALMLEKTQDFSVAKQTADDTKHRLERAFLSAASVQRDAERVTAEEIRAMIAELEQGIGGVYAILSEEYQRPLVVRVMSQMQKKGELPKLPDGAVSPQIVTGANGLARQSELTRLDAFLAGVSQTFGPDVVAQYINVGAYMKMRGTSLGLTLDGLVRTEEEVQSNTAAQQKAELSKTVAPSIVGAATKGAEMQQNAAAAQTPTQ